jgi:ABC-2 type transport system permease protein
VPDNLVPNFFTPPQPLTVYPNDSRPMEAGIFQTILEKAALGSSQAPPLFTIQRKSVAVHDFRYIEFLLPGVVAMAVMQMSVFSVAFVFAQYREKGVLKRILATPIRPYQFVTANIITRLTTSVAQAAILIATGMLVYHIQIAGAYWLLALCLVLGALVFLGLGFTISGLSKSVETAPVLANLIVFPMMFLGGVFFPGTSMPAWLQPIADNLPLTFFSHALRAVMNEGATLSQIQGPLIGMLVWATVLITLATLTFRIQERDGA